MAAAMLGAVLAWGTGVHTASAQAHLPGDPYFRPPASDIDPSVMAIDEISVLGNKIDAGTEFVDDKGNTVRWDAMLGKPFILVLSYYTCDGSCSVINATLAGLLKDVKAVKAGEDFRILTVSFDKNDNLKTAAAFRDKLSLPENIAKAWTIATFKNENDLKVQTGKIGFKFFWSPQDNAFLHPGAYLFFSPEGKLSRVLYQQDLSSRDVELAILDANLEHIRPTNIGNLVLSLCYSYNFKAGKYQLNIPFYVGVGALSFGLLTMFGSVLFYKIRGKGRVMKGANNAQVA
jgi:protein SCO1/2